MTGGFGAGDGKAKVFVQKEEVEKLIKQYKKLKKYMKSPCLLYTSPSPRDNKASRMPSSA